MSCQNLYDPRNENPNAGGSSSGTDKDALHKSVASEISTITEKTTPVDADVIVIEDSADSNNKKKLSWSNIKATLKTLFDTLYASITHTHTASEIATDVTNFDNNLSSADTDVQKALETLDELSSGGDTVNVETLTGNKTIDNTSEDIHYITLTASHTIYFDLNTIEEGKRYTVYNVSGKSVTYTLGIQGDDGSGTIHGSTNISSGGYIVAYRLGTELKFEFGDGSVCLGGSSANNYNDAIALGYGTINNHYRGIGIGYYANGNYSMGIGILGYGNSVGGIGIGSDSRYNDHYGIGIGYSSLVHTYYSSGFGSYTNGNSKTYSTAIGSYTQVERKGEYVEGIDNKTYGNRAVHTKWKYYLETTDGNTYEMYVKAISNNRMEILAKEVVQFTIQVTAIDSTNYDAKVWEVKGAIKRDASGNTSLVGSITKTVIANDAGASNWDIYVTADNTYNTLKVEVSEVDVASGKTIRWAATSYNTEVRFTY